MPRFGHLYPHDQDAERAQLVQSYMVLRAKQTSVQRRLSSPSYSRGSSPDLSPADSAICSPDRRPSPSASPRSPRCSPANPTRTPRSPLLRRPSVPSIPEHPEESDIDSDEEKLSAINARIKSTLTDLLACESVKLDTRMRDWVSSRLVDAHGSPPPLAVAPAVAISRPHHRRSASYAAPRASLAQGPEDAAQAVPVYARGLRIDDLAPSDGVRKLSI